MAYFLDNYPVSDNCADLVLTEEQEKYCRVVYKLDDKGGAYFSGPWDPDEEYSDEYIIVPLRSTQARLGQALGSGTIFANAIGSNNDPRPKEYRKNEPWIQIWEKVTNYSGARFCCTNGKFYDSGTASETEISVKYGGSVSDCTSIQSRIVGGHVILGKAADRPSQGASVYLLPICNCHNIASSPGRSSGCGFYMKLSAQTVPVILDGYMIDARKYIEELKKGNEKE